MDILRGLTFEMAEVLIAGQREALNRMLQRASRVRRQHRQWLGRRNRTCDVGVTNSRQVVFMPQAYLPCKKLRCAPHPPQRSFIIVFCRERGELWKPSNGIHGQRRGREPGVSFIFQT